jgi:hypothetical protein
MRTISIAGIVYEIGVCACPENVSLIVGEHCDECGEEVRPLGDW